MAAPRQYSDAQRQEMYRLYGAGLTSKEISQACAGGTGGVAPFSIPRRTVSDVVSRMAQEARVQVPATAVDVESLETVQRFPERIARILDAEIDRLSVKQRRGKLT
jgi:hypothetical protein